MTLSLHWQFIKMKLTERMAYRFDFFTSFFAYMLWQLVSPLFVLVMFYAGGQFPGWTLAQVLVLQGTIYTIRGTASSFLMGILWNTNVRISNGTFDHLLTRPVNALWLLIMDSFDSEDLGQILGGIIVLIVGLTMVGGIHGSLPLFLVLMVFGIMFFFSLALLGSAFTIKYIQTWRLYEFMTIITIIGGYPKTIYGRTAGFAFTVFIPLLIAGHYPASVLLGMDLSDMWLAMCSIVIFTIISLWIWHRTLRSYVSAGG